VVVMVVVVATGCGKHPYPLRHSLCGALQPAGDVLHLCEYHIRAKLTQLCQVSSVYGQPCGQKGMGGASNGEGNN
jgi:hypothetical protein